MNTIINFECAWMVMLFGSMMMALEGVRESISVVNVLFIEVRGRREAVREVITCEG